MAETVRVLMIEDDPDWADLMRRRLVEAGRGSVEFTLTCADKLMTGLALLEAEEFELVILDLMLPDSRGLDSVIRVRPLARDGAIVVMTNLDDEELAREAVARGAQDFLVKEHIDARVLRRALSYALERTRLAGLLESIIESAADGMVVVDEHGLVRYANAAAEALFGKKRQEMLGRPFPYPALPGRASEIPLSPQGDERVGELRVSEIEWRKSRAYLAMIRDLTDLRRLEKIKAEMVERGRIDKYKDQVIATVAHELRSPLSVVEAAVANLHQGVTGELSEPQSQMVAIARHNVERLSRIIDSLLDLSRLESGRAMVRRSELDAVKLVYEALEGARLKEAGRRLSLRMEVPGDLPRVLADGDMFAQVLENLLDNAMRFARAQIVISARALPLGQGRVKAEVLFTVSDDGAGIPEEKIVGLFHKFVQISRPVGAGYQGTGLGLAICNEIVKMNDGRIWVESKDGKGASFHFALPQAGEGGPEPEKGEPLASPKRAVRP